VPEAEALWLMEAEALWLAEAEAEAEPVAAAAAEVATLAGTEMEIPADSQMPARMGTSSVEAWSAWCKENKGAAGRRTGLVVGLALARDTRGHGLGDGSLASGALALDVGDTTAGGGDGSDKAGNLDGMVSLTVLSLGIRVCKRADVQRSWGPGTGQGSGPRQRRAKRRQRRWWRNAW
jgi:hypothetical protein